MDKAKDKRLCFYITGFGKFGKVIENPTSILVNKIKDLFLKCSFPPNITLEYSKVLEVSIDALKIGVEEIKKIIDSSNPSATNIILHFGVAASRKTFSLEKYGYNNATFGIPDVCGNTPNKCQIDATSELDASICTALPIDDFIKELKHPVCVSCDPGRYICNYAYFYSLKKNPTSRVMFVHFPTFETVDQPKQEEFVCDLLKAIASSKM